MPGVKKFRLSKRKATTNLLKVHIPLCLVQSHVVKPGKCEQLNLTLKSKQGLLPNGWTLVDLAEIVLAESIYVEREQKVVATFSVVIKEGFCWDVCSSTWCVNTKDISPFQQQEHLHDVDKVISVLHDLDAPVCVGNGDNKFHALKQWKSGRFLGRSKHRKYVPPQIKSTMVILTFIGNNFVCMPMQQTQQT